MSDYVKILEGQLEELKRRLADSERLVDYWKNHPGHTFYIQINHTHSVTIHSEPSIESTYHYLVMMLRDRSDVEELLVSRYNGITICWKYSIHKSKAHDGVWCMSIVKPIPQGFNVKGCGAAASFDEAFSLTMNYVRDRYKIYDI